jgi:hypothetical protein
MHDALHRSGRSEVGCLAAVAPDEAEERAEGDERQGGNRDCAIASRQGPPRRENLADRKASGRGFLQQPGRPPGEAAQNSLGRRGGA